MATQVWGWSAGYGELGYHDAERELAQEERCPGKVAAESGCSESCWDQAAGSAGSKLLVLKIQYISQMPSHETLLLRSHLGDHLKVLHLTSFSEGRP